MDPRKIVPDDRLRILMAPPKCTNHSNAAGGKPKNDQSRATAWHVLRWADALYIERILIENVPEFRKWGPLDERGMPIKKKEGETYRAFIRALKSLGYKVDEKVVNCADYGDPTIRKRLFIQARRDKRPNWPEPTHAPRGHETDLFGTRQTYRAAREIIDWGFKSKSIYGRKKQLSPNTLRRIEAGLRRFGLKPILTTAGGPTGQGRNPHSVEDPAPTVIADSRLALAEPFLTPFVLGQQSGAAPRSVDQPLPTVAGAGAISFIEPFLMPVNHSDGTARSHDLAEPMPTLTAKNGMGFVIPELQPLEDISLLGEPEEVETTPFGIHMQGTQTQPVENTVLDLDDPMPNISPSAHPRVGLVQPTLMATPYTVELRGTSEAQLEYTSRPLDEPLTAVTAGGIHTALVEPYLLPVEGVHGGNAPRSMDDPLPTITASRGGEIAVIEPFLTPYHGASYEGGDRARSIDEPMPVVGTSNQMGLVQPFITSIFGAGIGHEHRVRSVDDPVPTVVGSNAIGLAEPYLVEYHSNGKPSDLDDPVPTITTRDRTALVEPELIAVDDFWRKARELDQAMYAENAANAAIVPETHEWSLLDEDDNLAEPLVLQDAHGRRWMLDIRFRMLQPKELAAAMSFPKDYVFTGNRENQVRQIGNAVPVMTAAALIENLLK